MLGVLLCLAATPMDANAAGEKLQKAKKYVESLAEFRRAIDLGNAEPPPSLKEQVLARRAVALAHLNVARSLALLNAAGRGCESGAERAAVGEQVAEALAVDPSLLERALGEPAFTRLKDTLWFQALLGRSPKREADVGQLLSAVAWVRPSPVDGGTSLELSLTATGAATLVTIDPPTKTQPKRQRTVAKGSWKLEGRVITLDFPKPPKDSAFASFQGALEPTGAFHVNELGSFTDSAGACGGER